MCVSVCVCLWRGKSLPSRELLLNKGRDNCINELRTLRNIIADGVRTEQPEMTAI